MYDVVIVGSSFSGLMVALAAHKEKRILLVEKRKTPGTPVNTTGAVPIEWLTKMSVMPSGDCTAGNLRGVELIAPNGESAVIKKPDPDGMVLYPDRYVKWLADKVANLGCEIMTDTTFKGLSVERPNGSERNQKLLTVKTTKGEFRTQYVVGADGTASSVGQSVGLGERPAPEDLHIGMEYTVENADVQDPEVFRLYLGHEVAPLGYAWSFPEGGKHLRVGLGIPESLGLKPKDLVDAFLAKYPQFKTKIIKKNGGIIPTAPPLKTAVKGNVLLVGDAAHFCSPLHGGGIWFGMQSGYLAGTALVQDNAMMYESLWKEQLGGVLSRHYKLKRVIYSMSDKNFDELVELLKKYVLIQKENLGFATAARKLVFSDPGFVFEMALKWMKCGLTLDVVKRMIMPSFRIA
ncbi:MAG TPA: NAD(P)/FAD-dependent oxidoreductase [Nitrososphaerales archaeon]|nr:NAD(P)/FAD-dependent oxidoreductase [Nitrososphaerales archaeon]